MRGWLRRQGPSSSCFWATQPTADRELFYADLLPDDADRAIARLKPFTLAAVNEPLTVAARRTVSSTYVVCENDDALPVAFPERLAARADNVRRLPTSHSPFFSRPSDLGALIVEAAANA
jgi:hypothetical protein